MEQFSAYDLIVRPNFIPSRDNKIQNLKPVSLRQSKNTYCGIQVIDILWNVRELFLFQFDEGSAASDYR